MTTAAKPEPKKLNHHLRIAFNHMEKRKSVLLTKRAEITKEIDEIDASLLAFNKE